MAGKLPAIKPRQLIRALEKAGRQVHRQKGSHVSMRKQGAPELVVIPLHVRDLPRGTLHSIIEDAGLTAEQLLDLL
jgi:predicted RNA binding protein YcfA (HicA-like mRNA interferase family)